MWAAWRLTCSPRVRDGLLLVADQCFELGKHAYNERDYYHTLLWMQEALDRADREEEKTVEKHLVLDYLAFAASMVS